MKNNYKTLTNNYFENILIVFKSLLVGLAAGGVSVLYRITLTHAEEFSFGMYDFLKSNLKFIPLALLGILITVYFLGTLVSKNEMISGSGIPQVEGILKGYFVKRKNWLHTLVSKFLGGAIAIAGGLSLGREGPSIQLGACMAEGLGKIIGNGRLEKKILIASGASAGLSAAFNAPMAGVVFALEEIFKYFSPVILLSMMSSAVAADFVSKQVFGMTPIFDFTITRDVPLNSYWILVVLGIFLGLLGAIYNYSLIKIKILYGILRGLSLKAKILIPFLMAGVLGIVFPVVLGGGHRIIEELTPENSIGFLAVIFIVKFIFSMVSFGSGAPGGIFFPLIILGSVIGAIFAKIFIQYMGVDQEFFNNLIILAMAGYFTAIVRAPITGIVLVMEMTGSFSHILPLTVVVVTAYIVADLVNSPPIYESLLGNLICREGSEIEESHKKIVVEIIVKHGSVFEDRKVKDIDWPGKSLLVGIKHGDKEFIPKGNTEIKVGDYISILTDINSEYRIKELLEEMNEVHEKHLYI